MSIRYKREIATWPNQVSDAIEFENKYRGNPWAQAEFINQMLHLHAFVKERTSEGFLHDITDGIECGIEVFSVNFPEFRETGYSGTASEGYLPDENMLKALAAIHSEAERIVPDET